MYGEGREIISLDIVNDSRRGKEVFSFSADRSRKVSETFGGGSKARQPKDANNDSDSGKRLGISDSQMLALEKELKRTGVKMEEVKERYQFEEPMGMSEELYGRGMRALAKTKSADVA